jgi:hypothetical protein
VLDEVGNEVGASSLSVSVTWTAPRNPKRSPPIVGEHAEQIAPLLAVFRERLPGGPSWTSSETHLRHQDYPPLGVSRLADRARGNA